MGDYAVDQGCVDLKIGDLQVAFFNKVLKPTLAKPPQFKYAVLYSIV